MANATFKDDSVQIPQEKSDLSFLDLETSIHELYWHTRILKKFVGDDFPTFGGPYAALHREEWEAMVYAVHQIQRRTNELRDGYLACYENSRAPR
jgi:hypothetical protein